MSNLKEKIMKTLSGISGFKPTYAAILIFLTLLLNSSGNNLFLPNSTRLVNSLKSSSLNNVKVYPSSAAEVLVKAQEDWQNINNALQDAGSGDVVELAEGLFYLHKTIIKYDFIGTLKGSGKGQTTVQTAPGIVFDVSEAPFMEWNNDYTTEGHQMFCLPHQYNTEERMVIISDMKIVVSEPTTPYQVNIHGAYGQLPETNNSLQVFNVYYEGLDNDLLNPIHLNVHYKDINITGLEDSIVYKEYLYSISCGLVALGASSGEVFVDDINITNAYTGIGIHVWTGGGPSVTIKGSRIENVLWGISSEMVKSWVISENEIINSQQNGIYLSTFGYQNESAVLEDNLLFMDAINYAINGIKLKNVKVRNNVFTGSSKIGVRAKGDNWLIEDNDFCGFTANRPDGANIVLRQASNCTVKDNANQIVGGSSANDPSNSIEEPKDCN